jgi:hypothetical protein
MKSILSILSTVIVMVFTTTTASTQILTTPKQDALFPEAGKTTVTFWTGIPYIGIAEYAYAITDKFTVGLIGGYTPTTKAIGIRLRGIVAEPSDNFRLYLKGPILFYPGSEDSHGEPWLLAWPTLNAEWRLDDGMRIWTGAGLIGAGCAHHVLGIEDKAMEMGGPGFHGGVWNTLSAGISKPTSERIELHAEVAVVMKGLRTANDKSLGGKTTDLYWDGGLPLIIDLGMSYAF